MFIGPWDMGGPWNFQGIEGVSRFLDRVWNLVIEAGTGERRAATGNDDLETQTRELRHLTHSTLKKVTEDIGAFKFNTMLAALMEFNNYLIKTRDSAVAGTPAWDEAIETLTVSYTHLRAHETRH